MRSSALGLTALLIVTCAAQSRAQGKKGDASGSLSASTSGKVTLHTEGGRPTSNYLEFGVFGGAMFPSTRHNLVDAATEAGLKPHRNFNRPSADFGARIAYFPLRYIGVEAEGAYIPSGTPTDGGSATLWAVRGHLIAQLPIGIVTPFVLGGLGRLGAKSDDMGSDSDPAIHFGGGVKLALGDVFQVRLDGRDTLTQRYNSAPGVQANSPEVLLGLSATLGLSSHKAPPPPPPPPPKDTDKDGIPDSRDKCPTLAGPPPDGCPPKDTDKDGIPDSKDKCPTVAGVPPDGCPKDTDKDGIPDFRDKCPTEPETKNGYQDEDGCPDQIPEKVKKFSGVIKGIQFDFGKSTIRPESRPTLDKAAEVLKEYPDVRIEIRGYTDNRGSRDHNLALSKDRAEAVKTYLVGKGIDASRIQTKGLGPDEPIGDNKTAAGRQKNRRIEFKLISH